MCGIAGFAASRPLAPDDRARATRMRDVLAHRGPDGAGLWTDAHAVLAHRRLAIVDLAGGQQPLASEDDRLWVTYNGEIYNHRDVRAELEAHGHRYRTRSDLWHRTFIDGDGVQTLAPPDPAASRVRAAA